METAALLKLASMVLAEVPTAIDIAKRLMNGDATAADEAKDWLGVTGEVADAIEQWEKTQPPAA